MIDFAIDKLSQLMIKQKFKDVQNGTEYVKKIDVYIDLIKLLKKIKNLL